MKKISLWKGGWLGGLSALVVVALNYLSNLIFGFPRVSFQIFDWMARILPGDLLTFTIDTIVGVVSNLNLGQTSEIAKMVEQGIAIFLFLLLGVLFGGILAWIGKQNRGRVGYAGLVGGGIIFIWVLIITLTLHEPEVGIVPSILWSLIISLGWGYLLAQTIQYYIKDESQESPDPQRRQFLRLVGIGSFTLLVTAAGVSVLKRINLSSPGFNSSESNQGADINTNMTSGPAKSPDQDKLQARFEPPVGTRPELTKNEDFYRVDINTTPPSVDIETWQLELNGLVNQSKTYTLEDLKSKASISQAITLECISNPLGGDLISTSIWTGVPLKILLDEAGLQEDAQEVYIESVDGFFESVPMSEAMDERTLLVYEMNGKPLPKEHGYPLRIYIPDHFGMKQPKWITRLEVIDHQGEGYWVKRGWSETANVKTTSVIDIVSLESDPKNNGMVPVAGIAYAGARGINRVEVRVDEGEWQQAELRTPPLSPLTWVQWRYLWKPQPGQHDFEVRAYDGNGDLQVTTPNSAHPDGATGIDMLRKNVPES